jgi:hypothetical protein
MISFYLSFHAILDFDLLPAAAAAAAAALSSVRK